jgi:hypothetical protein
MPRKYLKIENIGSGMINLKSGILVLLPEKLATPFFFILETLRPAASREDLLGRRLYR